MTSTVFAPATARAPMVRAMFPVPIRVMLLMRFASCSRGSDGGGAAVSDQFQAVDVAGVVGGEEQGDGGNFFGTAHLAARDEGFKRGLGCLVEQFFLFGGRDLTRRQNIDPDLAVAQLVEPNAGP